MVGVVDGVSREQGGRENGGSKCYCIPIDYNAGQDIKELNVDADSADHVHCTEPKCYRSRGADEGYVDERTVCGSVSVSTSAVRCVVVGEWTY
jgi:hypothetical protein